MREIKFRCWNGEDMISPDYIARDGYGWWKENSIPTSSKDLMQYTGLKDKNGKEIYEGDVIKDCGEFIGEVLWVNSGFIFKYINSPKDWCDEYWPLQSWNSGDNHVEIIGNIHENPELMKEN